MFFKFQHTEKMHSSGDKASTVTPGVEAKPTAPVKPEASSSQSAENNTNGEQATCASSCGVNQAYVGAGSATAPGATQVSANHIIQYPKQYKPDDGKWLAIGSLIGSLIGKFADKSSIKKAKEAENKWKDITQKLYDRGRELWQLAPQEKDKADEADSDLDNNYQWNIERRDAELARAMKLDNCNDELHQKFCQFALCGYKPDYDGIKSRIMADVASQTKKAREQLCKNLNRYAVRQCCGIETQLATTAIATTVSALYKAREDERARAWQINEGLISKATEMMEKHRDGRTDNALQFDKHGVSIREKQYSARNANFHELNKLGADMMTSAGKNYAWLAESYRKTSEKIGKSYSLLGAIIAGLLAMFLDKKSGENDCGGSSGDKKEAGK